MNDKRTELTAVDLGILSLLGIGPENAISRKSLSRMTGLEDATIRASIKELRLHEKPISNHFDGKGYYLATDREQLEPVIAGLKSRRNALDRVIYHLSKAAQEFDYVHNRIKGE